MTSLATTSFTTRLVPRLESCPPPPPGGQVHTAPVVTPPATGAGNSSTQGSAVVEARAAHNREVTGSTPVPATRSEEEVVRGSDPLLGRPLAAHGSDKAAAFIPQAVTAAEAALAEVTAPAGAVFLSDASMFILSLVAAHEGRRSEDILAQLIAAAANAIGIHSLIMRDAGEVDLADLPDFALRAANRFRGGGP